MTNLEKAEKAEAPGRAGLAAGAKARRARWDAFDKAKAQAQAPARTPDMIAAAQEPVGRGLAAARGQFGGPVVWEPNPQSMGALASSGPVDTALHGLVERLIRATVETNQLLAKQGKPRAPGPLPISGPGNRWP